MLEYDFVRKTEQEVAKLFGRRFVEQLAEIPEGSWQGPIEFGTKTDHRVRDVPLVQAPMRPTLTRPGFESGLRRLSARRLRAELEARLGRVPSPEEFAEAWEIDGPWKVTPYQGRKTFDRWMQQAGVPRVRRRQYLGHGEQDVSDRYEFYEVDAYLAEDAKRMRGLLPKKGIRLAS